MRMFARVESPETVRVPCPVREFETIICEVEASAPIWRDVVVASVAVSLVS